MDKMDFALQVLVIGFSVVMFTLFILYGILILFSHLFNKNSNLPAGTIPIQENFGKTSSDTDENHRTSAVIAAAVYQYMSAEKITNISSRLKVAIEPNNNIRNSSWRIIGRNNILKNRDDLENNRRKK